MDVFVNVPSPALNTDQFRRCVSDITKLIGLPPSSPSPEVSRRLTTGVVKKRVIESVGFMNTDGCFTYAVSEYALGRDTDDLFNGEREFITSYREYTPQDIDNLK